MADDRPDSDSFLPYVYAGTTAAAAAVLPVIATILTAVRFYVRRSAEQGIGMDDWILIPAILFFWGMAAVVLHGIAIHIVGYPTPPIENPSTYNQLTSLLPGQATLDKLEYSFWALSVLTFGCIKLAVLFFYRRVFALANRSFNIVNWVIIAICALWTLAFFFGQIFTCGAHPSYYWGPLSDITDHCAYGLAFLLAMASSDLLTDVLVFFLPFPIIWQLHMPTRKKISISLVFLIGSVSLVASAFRLSIHVGQAQAGYARKIDFYLTFTLAFYWTLLEAGIALIAVNLFTLSHFFGMRSVQSVVGSVRSVLSLQSIRSNKGSASAEEGAGPSASPSFSKEDDSARFRKADIEDNIHSVDLNARH